MNPKNRPPLSRFTGADFIVPHLSGTANAHGRKVKGYSLIRFVEAQ